MREAPDTHAETSPSSSAASCPCGSSAEARVSPQLREAGKVSKLPPNREQIGRASWRVLHSMAARYPEVPTSRHTLEAAAWIFAFSALYPCQICRLEFFPILANLPPRLDSRESFVLWACAVHNKVNEDISAPLYACNLEALKALGR
ncbi:Erv1 / Alr family protein [Toxoplasma gondii TgCatPRC2]|uniref:Sulfhydryl oxidase n=11 Tax=Toxoplasma gondii TaxID=5811 RepID=A0A125YR10_TOXGV|nr:Erv1 / Alr family protein [Toxoplasma gondii ME49]EPR58303.1 Erv1 / Alr family protein [Toxoplasma gondii GT1]ESS29674.1 Erv1 / Alr family protein [Toxoplasma gondii VEG]KAF4645094.1 Erv1 / Alr family protein [Toxoplasma gondii]KFG43128.1 Erv1 / Alr family protein [Toxoplasma gondii p89]KFG57903.1 Erv1 / Alr family protein [Toxoplasma gondii RUB]KFG99537.1 Erv1 / Alr family protein [Toxoplasma gondii VAND]KYF39413.1 Erv1 / Alr family protein [Toxoplasma gondii ARI]KYK63831.1 Erv1 / Alr f|eukprot:XP_018637961.1 Erv1 / Alr family protein [Toxoplasma gondii ME49]